jgi:hypothetical protein
VWICIEVHSIVKYVVESYTSAAQEAAPAQPSAWLKLGLVAAASVLAGGVAAAWWYRKTLTKLREAEENSHNLDFRTPREDSSDDA